MKVKLKALGITVHKATHIVAERSMGDLWLSLTLSRDSELASLRYSGRKRCHCGWIIAHLPLCLWITKH